MQQSILEARVLYLDMVGKLEEVEEEDVMSTSLLEKAGLQKPAREEPRRGKGFDPADFLLKDDD